MYKRLPIVLSFFIFIGCKPSKEVLYIDHAKLLEYWIPEEFTVPINFEDTNRVKLKINFYWYGETIEPKHDTSFNRYGDTLIRHHHAYYQSHFCPSK